MLQRGLFSKQLLESNEHGESRVQGKCPQLHCTSLGEGAVTAKCQLDCVCPAEALQNATAPVACWRNAPKAVRLQQAGRACALLAQQNATARLR